MRSLRFLGPRNGGIRLPLIAAVVAILILAAVPVDAATTTLYNVNLVQNPGAEQGKSTAGFTGVAIPGWEPFENFTVVAYGTPGGFPTKTQGAAFGGQKRFFTTGPYDTVFSECDTAIQFITITGRNSATDKGHVKLVLSAEMATYGTQTDTAHVTLAFRDDHNHQLTTANSGPLALRSVTRTNGSFKLVSASRVVPKGTRTLRITLSATNTVGYCDAYFDNISVKILSI